MASKAGIAVAVVGTVATPPTIYYTHRLLTSYIPAPQAPVISVPTDAIPQATLSIKRSEGKAFETQNGCVKEKFPNLGEIKGTINASGTTKPDSDKTSITSPHTGNVDGCLNVDLKWRNQTDKQHAIAGTLEMTLTRGSHGLIFRTVIANLLDASDNDAFQYLNQAFKLSKQNDNKWKIDDGYLWTDEGYKSLSESATTDKVKLTFGGLINAEISYWDLCTRGTPASGSTNKTCDKLQDSDKSFAPIKLEKKKWTSKSGEKEIFQHLTIKGGKEGEEKTGDLWGNKSSDLFKGGLKYGLGPYLYEKDNGFYTVQYDADDNKPQTNLTAWFAPFKAEKGIWS